MLKSIPPSPSQVAYELWETVLSLILCYCCTTTAFLLLLFKLERPVADYDLAKASQLDLRTNINAFRTTQHGWLMLAALCLSSGVCTMHYTGMAAMRSIAESRYNFHVVALSCVIAFVASAVALYCFFVLPISRCLLMPTALLFGLAVCGMHYTGMYGVEYTVHSAHMELQPKGPWLVQGEHVVRSALFFGGVVNTAILAYSCQVYEASLQEVAQHAATLVTAIRRGDSGYSWSMR